MELDNSKKVTNEVVIIAKKITQKEISVVMKVPVKVAQLLNTASCSSEADLFVEMQKQQWHFSISEQNGVQDDAVNFVEEVTWMLRAPENEKFSSVNCVASVTVSTYSCFFQIQLLVQCGCNV